MGRSRLTTLRSGTLIALIFLAGSAIAKQAERWFAIHNDSAFVDVVPQLQVLVNAEGHARTNRFCIVGQQVGADRQAYVYWSTDDKLILWEPQTDNPRAILASRRFLDLHKDVAEDNEVGGSTYRVTRRFVATTLAACRLYGTKFMIQRTGKPPFHG